MTADLIEAIEIDADRRLHVKPASVTFPYIWREGMEVYWDPARRTLHSPPPREWTHCCWFGQILGAANAQGCKLQISGATRWTNVPQPVRDEIILLTERLVDALPNGDVASAEREEQAKRDMAGAVGDDSNRARARVHFHAKEYGQVVRLLQDLRYPELMSPVEVQMLRLARARSR
jgi:hypothetical protein